jgi:uncharacterized membrane protein YebE (DUF533 family)
MKTATNRKVAFGTLAVMGASTLGGLAVTSSVAQASEKGRLNTTLGLGAVTAYGLLKKKKTVAIGGAVGTAVAYSQYRKSKKRSKREEARRVQWYQQRYGRFWRNYYKPGA